MQDTLKNTYTILKGRCNRRASKHLPNCNHNLHEKGMPNHDTHLPSCWLFSKKHLSAAEEG